MSRSAALAGAVCALLGAAGLFAATAAATNECQGLQVCVPVVGPWVVTSRAEVQFQLDCPRRFIVGGLDAELSRREIDVGFVGGLGSPVNPGVTTTGSAVFLGRSVGADPVASFRPHIGCVPAAGGGQRTPTAYRVFKPGKPTVRIVKQLDVLGGVTRRLTVGCPAHERLASATHAVGFYVDAPPSPALAASVHVTQVVRNGVVHVAVRGGPITGGPRAVVQVDLVCAVAA